MITDSVRQRLRKAENVVVFTGAGISAESGITTFRDGLQGLWAKYNPAQVASPGAFSSNPQLVWDFYVSRADTVRKALPNRGHRAITLLADAVKKLTVITQNVDGLHQRTGSQEVLELHGNLFRLKSFVDEDTAFANGKEPIICHCCNGYADPTIGDPYAIKEDFEAIQLVAGPVPRCPGCETLLRPDVVWFSEMLNHQILSDAINAVDACDLMICIGSSLEVEPAASLPYRALERGAILIEVNTHPALSGVAHASLVGAAGTVLPVLLMEVWGIEPDCDSILSHSLGYLRMLGYIARASPVIANPKNKNAQPCGYGR